MRPVQSYHSRISLLFLSARVHQHDIWRSCCLAWVSGKAVPSLWCPWSTQTGPEPDNLWLSEGPGYSKGLCLKPHYGMCSAEIVKDTHWASHLIPLLFQNGREMESTSVLPDSPDLLRKMWWAAPNLHALPGKLEHIFFFLKKKKRKFSPPKQWVESYRTEWA